jgi:3-oxoacyl-[acyl-carrier protein] reductase
VRSLDGAVAVVTGAAQGIGRGIAEVLTSEGACVLIADIDGDSAARTASELPRASAIATDVTSRESTDAMAAAALERHGRIDILAANAGIYPIALVDEISDREWDHVMDLNAKGALHALQACLPAMREQRYGRIVLTSSITGPITGHPGFGHYGASKAAMLGMMRSVAIELATTGVTINAVMPGNVRTPGVEAAGEEHMRQMMASIPMRDFAAPEDIGWAVRFLASAEARYITGQTLIVDGGQVLPETPEALAGLSAVD